METVVPASDEVEIDLPDLDGLAADDGIISSAQPAREETYDITLKGGGLVLTREINRSEAWAVLSVIFGQQSSITLAPTATGIGGAPAGIQSIPSPRPAGAESSSCIGDDLSVGEFVHQSEAKRHIEKICAIAVYLANTGQERFVRDDIKQQFQRAGEVAPANFHRDFSSTLTAKWIAPGEGDTFFVTRSGRAAVDQKFAMKSPVRRRKATKKTSTSSSD